MCPPLKVIFVDVDGVLNQSSTKEYYIPGIIGIDPRNVAPLNSIIEKSGAKLVISSSWRKQLTMEALVKLFSDNGIKGEVIGRTGCHPTGTRGFEIQEWLERHPMVESIVILDDDTDMGHLRNKLVQTSPWKGLRWKHVPRALKLLSEPLTLSRRAERKKREQNLDPKDVRQITDEEAVRLFGATHGPESEKE